MTRLLIAGVWAVCLVLMSGSAWAEIKVVASVKPVHSLVASVMEGVGTPGLLVTGKASPHTYSMRPSDAAMLSGADLVIWIGPTLETFLERPLASLAGKAAVLRLEDAPGLKKRPTREGGSWEAHSHDHDHDHGHDDDDEGGDVDPHLWLDPANAKSMAAAIFEALARADPHNAARYQANLARLNAQIDALDRELAQRLTAFRDRPFIVFHDAYQYFETRYGLNAVGAITVSPEQRPSARRLGQLRDRIRNLGAACVFAEPQFEPALIDTIIGGTKARKGVLDPEGADIAAGPDGYFTLMRRLASNFSACFLPG